MAIITQLFCDKVHIACGNHDEAYRSSLVKVLESDLREVEIKMSTFQTCEDTHMPVPFSKA